MPRSLKRHYGKGDLHFITFSCFERRLLLGTARARNLFVKEMGGLREGYGFMLIGYVLMPEHVHLLVSEPKKGIPSKVVQVLKQRVSRAMRGKGRRGSPAQLSLKCLSELGALRRFWQKRFYDFNVWSGKKLKEKLDFFTRDREAVNMHANPVIRGLVKHPKDWAWSSWGFYKNGESGLVKIDPME
jgi:putative transposase